MPVESSGDCFIVARRAFLSVKLVNEEGLSLLRLWNLSYRLSD
jgi:hypothetical protein